MNNYESKLDELIKQQKITNIYLKNLTKIIINKTSATESYSNYREDEINDEINNL